MAFSNSSSSKNLVGIEVIVQGLVQGVFFRASTQKTAIELDLRGWVKNLVNGDVAVVAYGDHAAIQALIDFLKVGPPTARVDNIEIKTINYCDKYSEFKVL